MKKIFDAHFHIIDRKFPLISNNNFVPPEFKVADYKNATDNLNIKGGVVVSGSYHGYDQEYLIHSLENLGDNFVGVAQLPLDASNNEIRKLADLKVRGTRFNIKRLDPHNSEDINKLAERVYSLAGLHSEFYIESSELDSYFDLICALPLVSVDHLGLTHEGFDMLLKLVEKGVKVKATGFGRLDFDPLKCMKEIYSVNPDSLMFGTDLPSTRAKIPFSVDDIRLIRESFNEEEQDKILFKNALDFYRLN